MAEGNGTEPSIEEILASIRKIISDDDGVSEAITVDDGSADNEEVLELTDVVAEEAPHDDTPPPYEAPVQVEHEPSQSTALPEAIAMTPPPTIDTPNEPASHREDTGIITDRTMAAATGAFAKLSHVEDPPEQNSGNGKTVEDIARELLRPMLRQWMDQNLPQIVERLVERELRKISRKAEDL